MFTKIKRLFSRKKPIQPYSSTLTTAETGTQSKAELNPGIHALVQRLNKDRSISNEELNKLLTYYFKVPPIVPGVYNFNKAFSDGFVFQIVGVDTCKNRNLDIEDITISLQEITYNMSLTMSVSVKEFHEVMTLFRIKHT